MVALDIIFIVPSFWRYLVAALIGVIRCALFVFIRVYFWKCVFLCFTFLYVFKILPQPKEFHLCGLDRYVIL